MPDFYYEAISTTGAVSRGLLEAESESDAATQLAACELTPQILSSERRDKIQDETVSAPPASEIRETLRVLGQATLNSKLRQEIGDFLKSNENELVKHSRGVDGQTTFVGALLAHSAKIGDPLSGMGPLIEFERDLRRVKTDGSGRFIYAYGMLLFTSCLFSLTDFFIGTTFREMFRDFAIRLPAITQLMLKVGPLFWSLTIALTAVPIVILVARLCFRNQFWFDRGLDSIILWGPWRRWRYSAQALAYLGSVLKSQMSLPNACETAASILPRPFNIWQLRELSRRVQSGANLDAACNAAKVHAMVMPFLLASERQGDLAAGCMIAARLLLERCRRRRLFFAYFIESFAMVFVLVTAIALFASYLIPIYSLLKSLGL